MGFEVAVCNSILDHFTGVATWTAPVNKFVALFNGDPTAGGTELTGNGYARVQHNTWNAAAANTATNSGAVTFPQASGLWTEATHFAIYDAATLGNRQGSDPLTTPKTVQSGDTASFAGGQLSLSITP